MTRLFRRLLAMIALLAASAASAQAPLQWSRGDAEALLAYVESIGKEGLDPLDYRPARLRAAIASGEIDAVASATFQHLAADLSQGHVRGPYRLAWHIPDPEIDPVAQQALLEQALASHDVAETLSALLPKHPEYAALRAVLAKTPPADEKAVERLRVNLERWRWMPHDLGPRYILVNVAGFELQLVEGGKIVARHKLIVGKKSTPTPQFATRATGLILNPWWDVPDSIIAESVGRLIRTNPKSARRQGYVWSRGNVRQAPGPGNSLGQMKLVMPNPFTVYIHDTPSKPLFDRPVRAFSHGCIRTQDPFGLAERLLAGVAGWDRAAIDRVVAGRATTTVAFVTPIPVYVAYFTAATDATGEVRLLDDIYGRDRTVAAQLEDASVTDGMAR